MNFGMNSRPFIIKYLLIAVCIVLFPGRLLAQDTTYYYGTDFGITERVDGAKYKRELDKRSARRSLVETYELDGEAWVRTRKEKFKLVNDTLIRIRRTTDKIWPEVITRTFRTGKDGLYHFTDRTRDNIILEGSASSLLPLHLEDTVISYYSKNRIKSISVYTNNHLVSNKNWLRNGAQYYDDLHYYVNREPEYSLGQVYFRTFIMQGIRESEIDLNQVRGETLVGFVVMEDGSLEGFHTITGVYTQLNNILIERIREMPGKWQPATLHGKPVRYHMNIPFNFIDRSENFDNVELTNGVLFWD
jgi:hypothetical protein